MYFWDKTKPFPYFFFNQCQMEKTKIRNQKKRTGRPLGGQKIN